MPSGWPTTSSSTPAPSSISWVPTPASTRSAGYSTGSPAVTEPSSPAAMPTRRPPWTVPEGDRPRASTVPAARAWISAPRRLRALPRPPRPRPTRLPAVPGQPLATHHRNNRNDKNYRRGCFCGFCRFCGAWRLPGAPPMRARSSVTLSSENGRSRFWPSPDTPPTACSRQKLRKVARRGDPSLPPSLAGHQLAPIPRTHLHNLGLRPFPASGDAAWRSTISAHRSGRW